MQHATGRVERPGESQETLDFYFFEPKIDPSEWQAEAKAVPTTS